MPATTKKPSRVPSQVAPRTDSDSDKLTMNIEFVGSNPNHHVEIENLDLNLLQIDPTIQRGLQHGEIARIKARFNEAALGPLIVSARETVVNGRATFTYFILDGQQRSTVLRDLNWAKPVTAFVHYKLTKAEEAELFLLLNERNSVGPWDRFKAALVAERPVALGIAEILQDLEIPLGPPHGFNAIVAAERVYGESADGPGNLRWALGMIKDLYNSDQEEGGYDGRVIRAFAFFYKHFRTVMDEDSLRRKLFAESGGINGLIGKGRVIEQVYRGSMVVTIAEAIVVMYNKSTRGNTARSSKALPSVLGKREPGRRVREAIADMPEIDGNAELGADAADD